MSTYSISNTHEETAAVPLVNYTEIDIVTSLNPIEADDIDSDSSDENIQDSPDGIKNSAGHFLDEYNNFQIFNGSCLVLYAISLVVVSPLFIDISGFYSKTPEFQYPRFSGILMHLI